MESQGPQMSPSHIEVDGGICRERCQTPSVLETRDVPSLLAEVVSPYMTGIMICLSPGTTEGGGGGKWVTSMKYPTRIFSSPSLPAPCLLTAPGDALMSSGCGQGGDTPPAPSNPSLPPLVKAPRDCGALLCSQDRRAVLGSQPPGMVGLVPPLFAAVSHSMCKTRNPPFPALSLGDGGGWLPFWKEKIMQGSDAGETEQFSKLWLRVPPRKEGCQGRGATCCHLQPSETDATSQTQARGHAPSRCELLKNIGG